MPDELRLRLPCMCVSAPCADGNREVSFQLEEASSRLVAMEDSIQEARDELDVLNVSALQLRKNSAAVQDGHDLLELSIVDHTVRHLVGVRLLYMCAGTNQIKLLSS